jgi:hypothetical protein
MGKLKQLKSGTVVMVKLEHNLGYIYGKIINLVEILNEKRDVDELVYFYNYVTKSPEKDLSTLMAKDLLVGPLFVLDLKPVVKNGTWETVGFIAPTKDELRIPDFKEARPLATWDEDKATGWNYISNLNVNGRVASTFENVKHLEVFQYLSHDLIARRLTMEHLRQIGKKIEDYYKLKEWRELSVYKNMKYTSIYSTVPNEMRGRAISK